MEVVLTTIGLVGVVVCSWGIFQNFRTGSERKALLNLISAESKRRITQNRDDFLEPFQWLEAVPYDAHLWANLTFRDPWALYPDELFEHAWFRPRSGYRDAGVRLG